MPIGQPGAVERGRITLVNRGISRQLMFNPNDVTDDKQIHWGTLLIPGASHPVYQYGAGGERIISFELFLDGDRGQLARGQTGLSIKKHIDFYTSLLYPYEFNGQDMVRTFPDLISFNMGEMFKNIICICKAAPVKYEYWTPKMEPVRARIGMQLAEVVSASRTADEVFQNNAGFRFQ